MVPEDEGEVRCPCLLTRVPVDWQKLAYGLVLAEVTRPKLKARMRARRAVSPGFVTSD